MIIAIDFDGTCVTHEYPNVGQDVDGAVSTLNSLVESGHQLILFTMRSDQTDPVSGEVLAGKGYLSDAVDWFNRHGIPLYGVQTNPTQSSWTSSPKAHAELYIDDAALGCPVLTNKSISSRPFVDWRLVRNILMDDGIIKQYNHDRPIEDFQAQIDMLREHGFTPIAVSQMMFEEVYVFGTEEEAKRAYNEFEATPSGRSIGKIVGWWYGYDQFKQTVEMYEDKMGDGTIVRTHWLK